MIIVCGGWDSFVYRERLSALQSGCLISFHMYLVRYALERGLPARASSVSRVWAFRYVFPIHPFTSKNQNNEPAARAITHIFIANGLPSNAQQTFQTSSKNISLGHSEYSDSGYMWLCVVVCFVVGRPQIKIIKKEPTARLQHTNDSALTWLCGKRSGLTSFRLQLHLKTGAHNLVVYYTSIYCFPLFDSPFTYILYSVMWI